MDSPLAQTELPMESALMSLLTEESRQGNWAKVDMGPLHLQGFASDCIHGFAEPTPGRDQKKTRPYQACQSLVIALSSINAKTSV